MSKDQKTIHIPPVETVDKPVELKATEIIEWIGTTLKFWKQDQNWPCNLIVTVCDEIVSRSHINDK